MEGKEVKQVYKGNMEISSSFKMQTEQCYTTISSKAVQQSVFLGHILLDNLSNSTDKHSSFLVLNSIQDSIQPKETKISAKLQAVP